MLYLNLHGSVWVSASLLWICVDLLASAWVYMVLRGRSCAYLSSFASRVSVGLLGRARVGLGLLESPWACLALCGLCLGFNAGGAAFGIPR